MLSLNTTYYPEYDEIDSIKSDIIILGRENIDEDILYKLDQYNIILNIINELKILFINYKNDYEHIYNDYKIAHEKHYIHLLDKNVLVKAFNKYKKIHSKLLKNNKKIINLRNNIILLYYNNIII